MFLSAISFQDAVLLYPVATCLHVVEEWPGFPRWARRFASPEYSDLEYVLTHIVAVVLSVFTALLLRWFPEPWLVFVFFALVFGPGVSCNALFHSAATIVSRTYCPGTVTGVLLYIPLSILLVWLAARDGLVSSPALLAAAPAAALFHSAEVGRNVFKRW